MAASGKLTFVFLLTMAISPSLSKTPTGRRCYYFGRRPSDRCSTFLECDRDELVEYERHCPPSTWFSVQFEDCDYWANVDCDLWQDNLPFLTTTTSSTSTTTGTTTVPPYDGECHGEGNFPNPYDPTDSTYVNCRDDGNGGYVATVMTCPDGLVFDPEVGACWYECVEDDAGICDGLSCADTVTPCYGPNMEDAGGDCTQYDYCYNNPDFWDDAEWRVCSQECPINEDGMQMYFDPDVGACAVGDADDLCPVNPPPTECEEEGDTFPYPGDCHLYYRCSLDDDGDFYVDVYDCGDDMAYDLYSQSCQYPGDDVCDLCPEECLTTTTTTVTAQTSTTWASTVDTTPDCQSLGLVYYPDAGVCWYECVEDDQHLCDELTCAEEECYGPLLPDAEGDCTAFDYCYYNPEFLDDGEWRVCSDKCPVTEEGVQLYYFEGFCVKGNADWFCKDEGTTTTSTTSSTSTTTFSSITCVPSSEYDNGTDATHCIPGFCCRPYDDGDWYSEAWCDPDTAGKAYCYGPAEEDGGEPEEYLVCVELCPDGQVYSHAEGRCTDPELGSDGTACPKSLFLHHPHRLDPQQQQQHWRRRP